MSADTPEPPAALVPPETPTQRVLLHHAWRRMNIKNEHFMCAIVGREGKAKSHTALKIASGVDPTFTADRVFFNVAHALSALNSDEYGKGQMIVIDEAGVSMGNRTWYDRDQIDTNQALQTVRKENMGVLWTLPRLSELDSQTHGRLHAFIEMTRKYTEHETQPYAVGKWKNIDPTRDERDKLYKEYPRMRTDGVKEKIKEIGFTPPDPDLVAAYEPRKDEFMEEFIGEIVDKANEQLDQDASAGPKDIAQEIATDGIGQFVSENGTTGSAYINKDLIRIEFDISHSDANAVKALLEQTYADSDLEAHL
ncbi:hypothetical protein DQW50_16335 [Halorubrum sp. 48-1-W]|uniref:hypothetical protein n=1 Tax=Halorubrum sp. 48-1-W TaxID=2249761 RepID=UPI000DCB6338|nr:hypothetical protein [Halorubrum sp. 48-1-W]RAW44089.1 hypothetical protein DQW50_16335 [Halorubrum sp. 48-1-W]